jgi:Protein of unknown function, DUF547
MREHRAELQRYLARVADARLDRLAAAHLEALLVNAYNALTVQSILEHPDVKSIRDIDGVWTEALHRVGGFEVSLDDIEHRLLRPFFKDPRLHAVLNCASRSCAPLPGEAMDGERLDAQLEGRMRAFLANPRNARVEAGKLRLSKYFDWYGEDFTASGWKGSAPTIAAYVARYAPAEIGAFIQGQKGRPPIAFEEYDWSLNEAGRL